MEIIKSITNSKVKALTKLKEKKYRDQTGHFLVEGKGNVFDTLGAVKYDEIINVISTEDFIDKIPSFLEEKVIKVTAEVIQKISDVKTPSGVILVLKKRDTNKLPKLDKLLFLDHIADAGNLGTIIRTAVAAGFGLILCGCVDLYNPKVVRSCMSAINKADIYISDYNALKEIKNLKYQIYGADSNGSNVFGVNFVSKFCIIIGNESKGISNQAIELCDRLIGIPMEKMESLNASVSAGIIMYISKYKGEGF